jgi:hypothetical protein
LPGPQIVLQNYIDTVSSGEERRDRLTEQIRDLLPHRSKRLGLADFRALWQL